MSATGGQRVLNKLQMFASFRLGESELALAAVNVQEVVNVPEVINQIPLAPPFLKGIFNLRGAIIPVVDLSSLLGVSRDEQAEGKIAIIIADGAKVGLLFDSTSEILNVPAEAVCKFNDEGQGAASVVSAVLKINNGERLIEVIDPLALLKLENVAHLIHANQGSTVDETRKKFKRRQCITFKAGARDFGMNIGVIREIIRVPDMKRSTMQTNSSLGMVSLRGTVIPVLDFQKILQVDKTAAVEKEDQRIIILKIQDTFFGFMVDSVDSINTYYEEDLLPVQAAEENQCAMLRGMIAFPDSRNVLLLAEDQLLTEADVADFTRGHSALYAAKGGNLSKKAETESVGSRHPYISFKCEYMLSTRLSSVDEVADLAADMVKPPGYPDYVVGVQHMRGEVVTLVDLRMYYGMKYTGDYTNSRVLIVKGAQGKIGLLVDSVESIDTVDESKKIQIPHLFARDALKALCGDIDEVVEMQDLTGKKKIFMVMDMPEVLRKLLNPQSAIA